MPKSNGTSERELAEAVLDILYDRLNGAASYRELYDEVPSRVSLMASDLEPSLTRENEAIWEQRLRNITSHKGSPNNFIALGYLRQIEDGLQITAEGRDYVEAKATA